MAKIVCYTYVVLILTNDEGGIKMKYVKIPGQVFDLVKLFSYYFNKESYSKVIDNPEEYEHLHSSLLSGEKISDDLQVFFYAPDGVSNYISSKIFSHTNIDFCSDKQFQSVLDELSDYRIFGELIRFYLSFSNQYAPELSNVDNLSPEQTFSLLKYTALPDRIKLLLVHYCMNKKHYTNLLINELSEKYLLVERFFVKSKTKIEYTQRLIDSPDTELKLKTALGIIHDEGETVYCSVSAVEEKLATIISNNDQKCLIIGYGTIDRLQELAGTRSFDMFTVARALSDTLRINIVNMVKDRNEMNTTEIANAFGKGLTAVFYHLNMLAEAKVLRTRTRGRTVLYSINPELFNTMSIFSKEFSVNKSARL